MQNNQSETVVVQQHDTMKDFEGLRREGIDHLEQLAATEWTDFNAHDPGITILEQFCYALTDLSYRAQYELPDLLSHEGEDAYASLYNPSQILPGSPVTLTDLRMLLMDLPRVKNAWIDIVDEPLVSFDASSGEVNVIHKDSNAATSSPNISEINVKGLLRVQIEKSAVGDSHQTVRSEVTKRLHQYRGLCQDFQAIEVLEQQAVQLRAILEIDAVKDASTLLASVYQSIADYLSPSLPFHSLEEMLQRGGYMDEIFEGPLLDHGFIDTNELAKLERRTSVRISDLIQVLMAVPGIVAVKNLQFLGSDKQAIKDWFLDININKIAGLDIDNSEIVLEKKGVQVNQNTLRPSGTPENHDAMNKSISPVQASDYELRSPPGRDRKLANYTSIQRQFPRVYGIGETGLPQSATPERRAQAKQLKAYLMFYDQLLANQFAQLANVGKLFSFHDDTTDSYFSQAVQDNGRLGLDDIRIGNSHDSLQQITEDPLNSDTQAGVYRRNRFLDHCLARFGEQFTDYALVQSAVEITNETGGKPGETNSGEVKSGETNSAPGDSEATESERTLPHEERLARDKRAFLQDYPSIGRNRGLAFNYLEPVSEENISGLERTLRRKLGIQSVKERFYLLEHILMRPIPGDLHQHAPLFAGAKTPDPYSLQFTLVFPDEAKRFKAPGFRQFIEQTVREETPAHLTAHILWKDESAMETFVIAHHHWLENWRQHRTAVLDLSAMDDQ